MIQYKRFTSMVVAVSMLTVLTLGVDTQAADDATDGGYESGEVSIVSVESWVQDSQNTKDGDVQEAVLLTHEELEEKIEEQKKAEERERKEREAAEEAARKAAEEAARKAEEEAARQAAEVAAQNAVQASVEEQQLLASIIFCEAGNQPYEGQVAVGAVIMNRVRSGVFPNSISEVVYQPGQFSPAMSGWLDTVRSSGGYTDSAMQAAADALAGSNPIGDFLYFDCGGVGYQLGAHYFH